MKIKFNSDDDLPLKFFQTSVCMSYKNRKEHNPAGNYLFKVNIRNTRTRCEIC